MMRRRDFIAILAGSTVTWPLIVAAQVPAVPVIGYLGGQSPDPENLAKFHQGLNELGYFEGRNVKIEYRWALNQNQRLPALAAELVQNRVTLIVTAASSGAARAAKDATTTIPILFIVGLDPVQIGLVASLNRPGGNATGVSQYTRELIPKRLEVLKQLVPRATKIAYLRNDDVTGLGPSEKRQLEDEERLASGLGLLILYARNQSDIEAAFASATQQQIDALLVASEPIFGSHRTLLVALAARYALPACYWRREFADAGGLMSYGPNNSDSWAQIGRYAGRILNGAQPEELPVRLQNKFELVINMKTAKTLGLMVPPLLRALADKVIE
jgi:putative ABC transport system substrate-binding protein